jgi:hypothetical protein
VSVTYGQLTAHLGASLQPAIDLVETWGCLDDPAGPELIVGSEGVALPADRSTRAVAVIPGLDVRRPTPSARALIRLADAIALVDLCDLASVGGNQGTPVLAIGLPRPPERSTQRGLDVDSADAAMLKLLREQLGRVPDDAAGVAWVRGCGASTLAHAVDAWSRRRAVIALPGTARHPLLERGGVLFASSTLHAIEATRFLMETPALTSTLANRGIRIAGSLPTIETVATGIAESLELARTARATRRASLEG